MKGMILLRRQDTILDYALALALDLALAVVIHCSCMNRSPSSSSFVLSTAQ